MQPCYQETPGLLPEPAAGIYGQLFTYHPSPVFVFSLHDFCCKTANLAALNYFGLKHPQVKQLSVFDIICRDEAVTFFIEKNCRQKTKLSCDHIFPVREKAEGRSAMVLISLIAGATETVGCIQFLPACEMMMYAIQKEACGCSGQTEHFLREINWAHSHLLRDKVANIIGIIDLEMERALSEGDYSSILKILREQALKLDNAIKNTVKQLTNFIDSIY